VAHEAGHLWRVLYEVPGLFVHHHFDEDVTREGGLSPYSALSILHLLSYRFGRNHDLAEALLHLELTDALLERELDLVLVPGIGGRDVPLLLRRRLFFDSFLCSHAPYTKLVIKPQTRSSRPM